MRCLVIHLFYYLCSETYFRLTNDMKYSVIIPVFNRPDEVDELLRSLTTQTFDDFEVIVVEDGSNVPCKEVVERYANQMNVKYFKKENSGPGQTRNYGAERSLGEYLIILDSDCVLPPTYLHEVENELCRMPSDAFGGPDRAHDSFTNVQKAISYSMTSFFTTGGIRGGKKKLDKFYPRSFNMGVRAEVYKKLGGFSKMRFGEDIDFSLRIFAAGCSCRLFPDAWVWHKRRTDFKKFFRQVHNSGIARINLHKRHPGSLKPVHLLPMIFTAGVTMLVLAILVGWIGSTWVFQMAHGYLYAPEMPGLVAHVSCFHALSWIPLLPLLLFSLLIFIDATIANRSLRVGVLSIGASFVQLVGYGTGFIRAWWQRCVCGKDEFSAFEKNFYK